MVYLSTENMAIVLNKTKTKSKQHVDLGGGQSTANRVLVMNSISAKGTLLYGEKISQVFFR